jgi:hypothetical protein
MWGELCASMTNTEKYAKWSYPAYPERGRYRCAKPWGGGVVRICSKHRGNPMAKTPRGDCGHLFPNGPPRRRATASNPTQMGGCCEIVHLPARTLVAGRPAGVVNAILAVDLILLFYSDLH